MAAESKRDRLKRDRDSKGNGPPPSITQLMDTMVTSDLPVPSLSQSQSAIVSKPDGTFAYKRFVMTTTHTVIPEDVTEAEWVDISAQLRRISEVTQWAIGDLMAFAERKWGATYKQAAELIGYAEKSLREYAYVARHVHSSIRMDKLSFGHHQLVAGWKDQNGDAELARQQQWLERAADEGWSVADMREAIRRAETPLISDSNWLFAKTRVPRVTGRMQKMWSRARNGDARSRRQFLKMVDEFRAWLDEAEQTLDVE